MMFIEPQRRRSHRRFITPPAPPPLVQSPLSPENERTRPTKSPKSIRSVPHVLSAAASSPTSVLIDATASFPNGVSELKRIRGHSNQFLLPESMIYGNDLIKVWNIEDEQTTRASHSFDDTTNQTMIQLQEEATYSKNNFVSLASEQEDRKSSIDSSMFPMEEIDVLDEDDEMIDRDDLFWDAPPTTISLTARMSPSPLSPPVSPRESFQNSSHSSGSANTLVLDVSNNEELLQPTKPPKGHRRHRRNNSHFDFQFT